MYNKHVLALSWNIATEPKLYWQLVPNPYSFYSLQIISQRFPDISATDITLAIVLAEPEGEYDRSFARLPKAQQNQEVRSQRDVTRKTHKQLVQYCKSHAYELNQLPMRAVYETLSSIVFATDDVIEIQQRYSQGQRRDFRLSIVNFIEHRQRPYHTQQKRSDSTGLLLKALVAFLPVMLLFYFANNVYRSQVEHQWKKWREQILAAETQQEPRGLPSRLKVPSINVDADVEHLGLTMTGAMDVPGNTVDVGWYKYGPVPGETGSAVISGHFDGRDGKFGVFNNLNKLKPGDNIYLINDLGITTTFVVRESRTYSPGYAEEVFTPNDSAHLNLITCDGMWDGAKKSYNNRLVVFADIMS